MTALKKRAKKSAKKAAKPRVHKMTINLVTKTFKPNPLKLKRGELVKIVAAGTKAVDIKVAIDDGGGDGSGGPIVIHS